MSPANAEIVQVEEQLAPPTGGVSIPTSPLHIQKAHQRLIRERHSQEHDPFLPVKRKLARSFDHATVKEIDRATAESIILKYEWLGTMGTTDYQFGLYFGEYLAGAICFGRTAGTKTAGSICGLEFAHTVKTLNRGACVHWAHPHSASFMISRACRLMSAKGFHVFVAYSDTEAGEIGTVYQASNWLYCGMTGASSMFVWAGKPVLNSIYDGKPRDERSIQNSTRIRTNATGAYRTKCSRREMRRRLVEEGFLFFKTQPKHRYVWIDGDKATKRTLREHLKWNELPYPKRSMAAGA